MTSPARRHYLRTLAAQAQPAAGGDARDTANANAYELQLLQLTEHRRRLKQIMSLDNKLAAKREFLGTYTPWVEGVLQGDTGQQDEVLVTVLVWRIDVGDLAGALPLAEYALRHALVMPDQYHRGLPCVVAEQFAETALKQITAEQLPDLAALQRVAEITAEHDMPDEARAKLYKAIGYTLRALDDKPGAIAALQRALALNAKAGVKRDIELLERAIKNAAPDAGAAGGEG